MPALSAIGLAHFMTHDWFRDGPFYGANIPEIARPLEPADRMELYRSGKRKYELLSYWLDNQTVFALRKPDQTLLWAMSVDPRFGEMTMPYSREEIGWWGWRFPVSGQHGDGIVFISPSGNWRFYSWRQQ